MGIFFFQIKHFHGAGCSSLSSELGITLALWKIGTLQCISRMCEIQIMFASAPLQQ